MLKAIKLSDRSIITISGPDRENFLQGLLTNNISFIENKIIFSGLLSPQGKIQYDFFIFSNHSELFIDLPHNLTSEFIKRLSLYKLRSDVNIIDSSKDYDLIAIIGETQDIATHDSLLIHKDPRFEKMGCRAIIEKGILPSLLKQLDACSADENEYHANRIHHCIPAGGYDYKYQDIFPHEACYDLLNGVDFKKGCYVGQEIVSRMQHRGTARKRIVKVTADQHLPETGSEIHSNEFKIGILGSRSKNEGIAILRLDHLKKAIDKSEKIHISNMTVNITMPAWANYHIN